MVNDLPAGGCPVTRGGPPKSAALRGFSYSLFWASGVLLNVRVWLNPDETPTKFDVRSTSSSRHRIWNAERPVLTHNGLSGPGREGPGTGLTGHRPRRVDQSNFAGP